MVSIITENELMTINMLSNLRGLGARLSKTVDQKVSDKNASQIDFEGLLAEYAFCKINNLFYEISPEPRKWSFDCKTQSGSRVDIKATIHPNGQLIGKLERNMDIDIYVLAIINFMKNHAEVFFPGYAEGDYLYQAENIKQLTLNGPMCYALRQEDLRRW